MRKKQDNESDELSILSKPIHSGNQGPTTTEEATAALKGILGIGSMNKQKNNSKKPQSRSRHNTNNRNVEEVPAADEENKEYQNKNKQKNKQSAQIDEEKTPKGKKHNQRNNKIVNKQYRHNHNNYNGKKKHKNQNSSNRSSSPAHKNKRNVSSETSTLSKEESKQDAKSSSSPQASSKNFAWSAFQSSPDPSNLPLPVFSSNRSLKTFEEEEPNLRSAEKFEEEMIAAANAAASNPTEEVEPLDDQNPVETPQEIKVTEDENNDANRQNSILDNLLLSKLSIIPDSPEALLTTSNTTGINLAQLTKSSEADESPPTYSNPDSTLPKTDQESIFTQQTQQPFPQHFRHPHPPHPLPPPPPHLTPNIITVRVQVPPLLLPGRQMIFQTPLGYNLPIVVPENIQPGMIIPVNVPANVYYGPAFHGNRPPASFYRPGNNAALQ